MSCRSGVSGTRCRGWAAAMTDFEITIPGGPMVCGWCGREEAWRRPPAGLPSEYRAAFYRIPAHLALGYLSLTGEWALAAGPGGELVVVAFATDLRGRETPLPHHCDKIPQEVYETYADEIAVAVAGRRS
jgi:hypothetical protein